MQDSHYIIQKLKMKVKKYLQNNANFSTFSEIINKNGDIIRYRRNTKGILLKRFLCVVSNKLIDPLRSMRFGSLNRYTQCAVDYQL